MPNPLENKRFFLEWALALDNLYSWPHAHKSPMCIGGTFWAFYSVNINIAAHLKRSQKRTKSKEQISKIRGVLKEKILVVSQSRM